MKLKLNKKGADRIDIETMEYDPQDHVFESDDFEGVVVLTAKEAKVANRALAFGLAVSESLRDQDDFEDLAEKIDKRIECAEVQDE